MKYLIAVILLAGLLAGFLASCFKSAPVVRHPDARRLQRMNPGVGTCGRCLRPWGGPAQTWMPAGGTGWIESPAKPGAKEHITQYSSVGGCFPLCEQCWGGLTPEQRLPYYRDLWEEWEKWCVGYASWEAIKAAVLAEDSTTEGETK